MNMNKSVILLSGGLDSLVALGYSKKHTNYNVELALTFDFICSAFEDETFLSTILSKICEYKISIICSSRYINE